MQVGNFFSWSPLAVSGAGVRIVLRRCLGAAATGIVALAMSGPAQADVSFQGATIKMIIGSSPGGGTDGTGRIIARLLGKYLPGTPNIVVQNFPGASGVTAMNFFMRQTKPDGLTIVMGSNSS